MILHVCHVHIYSKRNRTVFSSVSKVLDSQTTGRGFESAQLRFFFFFLLYILTKLPIKPNNMFRQIITLYQLFLIKSFYHYYNIIANAVRGGLEIWA